MSITKLSAILIDPDNGIIPGTKWEDLPDDYEYPLCGVGKDQFNKEL